MTTLKYTEDHEWLRAESEDEVTIGITDHAQNALGDIVFVQLPEVGASFAAGDEAAVIESVKAAGELKMPLGEGWFIRVRLDDPASLSTLLDKDAYDALIA